MRRPGRCSGARWTLAIRDWGLATTSSSRRASSALPSRARAQLGPGVKIRFRRAGKRPVGFFSKPLPQALGRAGGLLRLVDNDQRIFGQRKQRMLARPHQRHREFPARKRIAGARDVHLIGQLQKQLARFGIFGQRQQRGLRDFHHGALGLDIESSDGFDQVAKQLDADRLGRFGRENIQDAAAQRIFADHFHRVALFVADAFQVRQQDLRSGISSPTRSVSASCR